MHIKEEFYELNNVVIHLKNIYSYTSDSDKVCFLDIVIHLKNIYSYTVIEIVKLTYIVVIHLKNIYSYTVRYNCRRLYLLLFTLKIYTHTPDYCYEEQHSRCYLP